MLLAHKVKPLPTEEQKAALPETVERFNEACSIAAGGLVSGPVVTGDLSSHVGPPRSQAHEFIHG